MNNHPRRQRKTPLEKAGQEWAKSIKKLKGKKRSPFKRFMLWTQCIIWTFVFAWTAWKGWNTHSPPIPSGDQPPLFFSNACDDDLRAVFTKGIEGAHNSIYLKIYSLTDRKVVHALKDKSEEGTKVSIVHDADTSSYAFPGLGSKVKRTPSTLSGLMHQKILIVDEEKVWIGSANLTPDSLLSHSNLVMGVNSPALASKITSKKPSSGDFLIGGQWLEYWPLPEEGERGLKRIISLIESAQKTIQVAMFTWTHPDLTRSIIRAHKRGIKVDLVIDYQQGTGVCTKAIQELFNANVPFRLSRPGEVVHHKFAWIDGETLIHGSANWTKAAFTKNAECFVVLHDLKEDQKEKLERLWKALRATSTQVHQLSMLWQAPWANPFDRVQIFPIAA